MHKTQKQEDIHISYISALCASAGISYDIQRHDDDSTDGIIKKRIILENDMYFDSSLRIQLKSTSSDSQYTDHGDHISYKLKVKNYNDLCTRASTPIILGLLILPNNEDDWVRWTPEDLLIKGCMYWADYSGKPHSTNSNTVTVKLDKSNILSPDSLVNILEKIAKEEWP